MIFKFGIDSLPREAAQELYKEYISFEKQHGDQKGEWPWGGVRTALCVAGLVVARAGIRAPLTHVGTLWWRRH